MGASIRTEHCSSPSIGSRFVFTYVNRLGSLPTVVRVANPGVEPQGLASSDHPCCYHLVIVEVNRTPRDFLYNSTPLYQVSLLD